MLVPAVGRKVIDLGGNLEKGMSSFGFSLEAMSAQARSSANLQIAGKLDDIGHPRDPRRVIHTR
jgi:hypothetical protein